MKRLVLASIGVLAAVTMITTANAADMGRRQAMPAKAPSYVPPYSWTGFYVGVNGGGGFGNSTWSVPGASTGFDTRGGVVGGTLGYNYQAGPAVFGVEGDLDWSNIRGSTSTGICTGMTCETRNSWLGTARGRIGYAFDRFMPFVTGGAAFGDIKSNPVGFGSQTTTRAGWTVGGGLEAALGGPWTAKVDYLYVDLGKANCTIGPCAPSTNVDFHTNLVRGGINYRF